MPLLDGFWDVMYEIRHLLRFLFLFTVFLFVLSVLSVVLSQPGTQSHDLSILNTIVIVLGGIAIGTAYRYSVKRQDG